MARVALKLASKQNDVVPLKLEKINQISRVSISKSEYIDLEADVLSILGYELPQGTIYELFKLYQTVFQLDSVFQEDAIVSILKRCVLDYKLLKYGPKAGALASVTHLCCSKRILINTSVATNVCSNYDKSL